MKDRLAHIRCGGIKSQDAHGGTNGAKNETVLTYVNQYFFIILAIPP